MNDNKLEDLFKAQDSCPSPSVIYACDHAVEYGLNPNPETLAINGYRAGRHVGVVLCERCLENNVRPKQWVRVK